MFDSNDYVYNTFKKLIEAKDYVVERIDEDGFIIASINGEEIKISLDNLRKDYEAVKEDYCIENFVEAITSTNFELPTWEEAKDSIYPSLFPGEFEFGDYVNYPISDDFNMIFVYDTEINKTWINEEQLESWGIDNKTILKVAYSNLDRVLESAVLEIDDIDGKKLAYFSLEDVTMKSVLILSKKLKDKVNNELGWPINAVIPVRDFCYLFAEKDFDFFAERLGATVMEEYQNSGYPITLEILQCNDEGVKAVGKYAVNEGEEQ